MINALAYVHCPYCNHVNKVALSVAHTPKQILFCDVENGGCDKEFIFSANVVTKVDVKTFFIVPREGETL